jgi:SNF2 family DNA or RNA helicase
MESFEPPNFRGGLLADQMGLGKSLSIISLIASNPLVAPVDSDGIFPTPLVASKATLLIVPLPRKYSVHQQWFNARLSNIDDHSTISSDDLGYSTTAVTTICSITRTILKSASHLTPNSLSWTIFHGSTKLPLESIMKFDIVITTYKVVSMQWKKANSRKGRTTAQRASSPLFSIFWHRLVLDEGNFKLSLSPELFYLLQQPI